MGLGDVLMSIGEAKRVHKRTGQPVFICDPRGMPVRSDLFNGVPYLTSKLRRDISCQRLVNSPGHRPYIEKKLADRWIWRPYRPEPADVVLTEAEETFGRQAAGAIIVEPNVKSIGHRNKDWGWHNWHALSTLLFREGLWTLQMARPGDKPLLKANVLPVTNFRLALACLKHARLYVGPEGGLHHGAAAVGTPAVVLFGEFISPSITGYATHANLFASKQACGMRTDCPTCRKAMNSITPDEVLTQINSLLSQGSVAPTPHLHKL